MSTLAVIYGDRCPCGDCHGRIQTGVWVSLECDTCRWSPGDEVTGWPAGEDPYADEELPTDAD